MTIARAALVEADGTSEKSMHGKRLKLLMQKETSTVSSLLLLPLCVFVYTHPYLTHYDNILSNEPFCVTLWW